MGKEEIFRLLEKTGQQHILHHYQGLTPKKKNDFLGGLQGLDLAIAFQLYEKFSKEGDNPRLSYDISPAPILPLPKTPREAEERYEARLVGERLIRENRVAVLIVAAGQGTSLGFTGAKGKFLISPVKKKSLFQILAESVRAISLRYQGTIPLLIMASLENRQETQQFFETNKYFGLAADTIYFFDQEMVPTITPEGKLILKDDTHLMANPDGHGGSLRALYQSGLLKDLTAKGFSEIFYCQVDNPLVKIADPVFIGFHKMAESEISTKVVRRRDLEERVGVYGMVNGRPGIIEYSDFRPEEYRALDERGNIRYWSGYIAVHMISLSFVQRLNLHGFALPYHRAVKDVEVLGANRKGGKITTWKFETFVFDAIPLARKTCCLEVTREEEFAPVKNHRGSDSPATVRAAMNYLHRSWLKEAGAEVSPEAQVEISPLFALNQEELVEKLKGKKLVIREDKYIE